MCVFHVQFPLKRVRVPRAEDDLTLRDYLAYCHMSPQEDEDKVLTRAKADNASRRFAQVDTAGKGRITWCQFLNIETVRILKKRNKVSRSRRGNKVSRSAFSRRENKMSRSAFSRRENKMSRSAFSRKGTR